jgi:biotin carboxyl carrier protein
MKYIVEIDGTRHEVVLEHGTARVNDGAAVPVALDALPGTPVHLVRVGDQVHRMIGHRDGERGRYALALDGRRYSAEALDERARAIRDLAVAAATASGPRPLIAPMPGLIVRVTVAVGDSVIAGQGVVAMEAMKMENELRAPAAGTVKRILAVPGVAVEKGATLIEFD